MASDVTMPRLSDSMEEGTILKWLVEEGGEVKRGEPLVEIETDKANMTYEADTDGVLVEVVAKEGDTLPVGEVIGRIGEEGEAPSGGKGEPEEEEAEARSRGGGAGPSGGPGAPPATATAEKPPRPATATATGASRPRRWPGGWRATWASSWPSSRAAGPAAGS